MQTRNPASNKKRLKSLKASSQFDQVNERNFSRLRENLTKCRKYRNKKDQKDASTARLSNSPLFCLLFKCWNKNISMIMHYFKQGLSQ